MCTCNTNGVCVHVILMDIYMNVQVILIGVYVLMCVYVHVILMCVYVHVFYWVYMYM